MILGKVIGTVRATCKDEKLVGMPFQIVRKMDPTGTAEAGVVVAVNTVGAGVGDTVLVVQGSSARHTEPTTDRPVDAAIIAIADRIDVDSEAVDEMEATSA